MTLLVLSIPVFALLNITMGSVPIPIREVANILLHPDSYDPSDVNMLIVMNTRLPQTLTALACGAGLAVAGLEMQTVFHNPLAGPSVLGISSAASLGVAFVVLLSGTIGGGIMSRFGIFGNTALTLAAIAGALAVMMLIVWLSQKVQGNVTLLIIGVMIGYIASAIIGVLKYFSSEEDIRAYVIWGLGSFARVTGGQVYVFTGLMALLLPFCMLLAQQLNMLLLGSPAHHYVVRRAHRYRHSLLRSHHVLGISCSAHLSRTIPHRRPPSASACHPAVWSIHRTCMQPHRPTAWLRGCIAYQFRNGTDWSTCSALGVAKEEIRIVKS